MPPSIVEKYEQIFAADPRSRIFVELARALLDRGEPERAIEVCGTGLQHHPSSILGRVIWGRSLLALEDLPGAQDQFEIAIALDPASPYAYNLVGESLLGRQLHREALPVLVRAAELQPADARVRGWLEEARRHVQDGSAEPPRPAAPAPRAPTPAAAAAPPVVARAQTAPASSPTPSLGSAPVPVPGATPKVKPAATAAAPPPRTPPASPAAGRSGAVPPPVPLPSPALHRDEIPRSLLSMIPGATRPSIPLPAAAAAPPPPQHPDEEEADRLAARFEQEVREKLLSQKEPAPPFHRRHRGPILAGVFLAGVTAAVLVFLHVRAVSRAKEAVLVAARARAGLARDTAGALHEASRLLAEARQGGGTPELDSLAAQVAAVLATEFGDADERALASELAARPGAGDGAHAAAYLLAATPAERSKAESGVLAAPPSSEPLLQALAGRILLKRGEAEAGKGRLEIAAGATPPLLRALSDLGDMAMARGDPEGALGYYGAALSAHPTHPRSVVGAAEARLALGLDLPRAHADLEAVEADPGSRPPLDLRVRYEIASARILAATGDPSGAAARLSRATAALGENPALALAYAEVLLASRAFDRAETVAARAVALSPGDPSARVLLARAWIGRGRYAEALAATSGAEGRAIRLQRGIARYRLGQMAEARRELEHTSRDGRMPAEAVVWLGLTEVKDRHAERGLALLEKLAATRSPPPFTWVALGQALEAMGRTAEAETAYRSAVEHDPAGPEGHAALGLLLQSRGAAADAVPELQKAEAADPTDLAVRRALGAARLATGQPSLARAELDTVLMAQPADLDALCLLSAAWLADGRPEEARRAADRGLARAPRNARLLVAAARAAQAQGDRADARKLADRAVKAAGRGPDAAQARALQAELRKRCTIVSRACPSLPMLVVMALQPLPVLAATQNPLDTLKGKTTAELFACAEGEQDESGLKLEATCSLGENQRHGALDLRAQRDAGRVLRPPRRGRQR
jgi:tetratricopeptide (TPR) repeat protein